MCSWYEARARATKGETCADQMTESFSGAQRCYAILAPNACDAFRACEGTVKRLYCAVCAVFMGVLSTPPVDFLEFFPGNRSHHHFSDDVGCLHELQLVCHCDVGHCGVEDEDAACGFPRGSL